MVDDSTTILKLCGRMLVEAGYQPFLARDMPSALDFNIRDHVDLILIDVVMPGMDGLRGIRALREKDAGARIVAMSSGDSSRGPYDLLRRARRAGADAVIEKPFGKDDLLDVLEDTRHEAGAHRLRVLAIDDSPAVCSAIASMLDGDRRYRFNAATSAEEALASPHIVGVDVIVTDIFMPGESGIEVITRVRDNWPDVRIIAMSAGYGDRPDTQLEALRAAQKIGAAATLRKPFDQGALLGVIADVTADLTA